MDHLRQDPAYFLNFEASYNVLENNGPAMPPLAFPRIQRQRAERVNARVYNSTYGESIEVENNSIIYRSESDGSLPLTAYWVGRTLKRCIYGVVKHCTVLQLRDDPECPWEITNQSAAVKIMSLDMIQNHDHVEDPIGEVAAMYYMSSRGVHPHVIAAYDILQDDDYLMLFMPFCASGDMLGYLNSQPHNRLPEPLARYWFRQLLEALSHLQRMGVTHRDLSLENVMIDEETRSVVIDLGMCLRIPYTDGNGGLTGVDGCSLRYLIARQAPCGKPMYVSPEVVAQETGFDGFAVDLWAAGVILFMMLTGRPAWDYPNRGNPQYTLIVSGALEHIVKSFQVEISNEAIDLLQAMMQEDPRKRLTMAQILQHPWVHKEEDIALPPPPDEEWRY